MSSVHELSLLVFCFSLFTSVLSQSSSDLTVTVIAQSQWHFVGEELYLLATSSHPDLDIVAWEHEETVLQSSVHHVISTLAGGERSTLRIPSLSPGDGGTYTIVARDTGGNEHRKASQDLQLLYPAVITAAPVQHMVENSTDIVNCSSPNSSVIFWLFNSQDPVIADSSSYTQLQDGRLQINRARLKHAGVYQCEVIVQRYGRRWTQDIMVEIIVKPSSVISLTSPSTNTTTIVIQWTIVASTSGPVDCCSIQLTDGESTRTYMYTPATQLTADMSAEYAIGGLTPGVSYTVTVTPVNRAGEGPRTEIGVNTVSVVPRVAMVTAEGYNLTSIWVTVALEYRGSPQPISFRVTYLNSDTQATHSTIHSSVTLDGLRWSTVVEGLDFSLFSFSVVAINDLGESEMVSAPPTYPKPVNSLAPVLRLKSASWHELSIQATMSDLGLPPITAVILNISSTSSSSSQLMSVSQTVTSGDVAPLSVVFSLTGLDAFTEYEVVVYGSSATGSGDITRQTYNTYYVAGTVGIVVALVVLVLVAAGGVAAFMGCRYFKKHAPKSHHFHTAEVVDDVRTEPQQFVTSPIASPLPSEIRLKRFSDSPEPTRHSMSALVLMPMGNGTCHSVISEQTITSPAFSHLTIPREMILDGSDNEGLKTPDSVKNMPSYQCSTFV
jgi:hypothetical protein